MRLAAFMIMAAVLLATYGATIDLLHPTTTKSDTYCYEEGKNKICSRRMTYDKETSKHSTAGLYLTSILLALFGTGLAVLVHIHRQDVINKELE